MDIAMEILIFHQEVSTLFLDTAKKDLTHPAGPAQPTLGSKHFNICQILRPLCKLRGGQKDSGALGRADNWKPPKHLTKHKCVDKVRCK